MNGGDGYCGMYRIHSRAPDIKTLNKTIDSLTSLHSQCKKPDVCKSIEKEIIDYLNLKIMLEKISKVKNV